MLEIEGLRVGAEGQVAPCDEVLGWKFMICSHCQELGQLADLASDWLFTLV